MLHTLALCGAPDTPQPVRQAALGAVVTLLEQEFGGADAVLQAWQRQTARADDLWLQTATSDSDAQARFGYALALARASDTVRQAFSLPAQAHIVFRLPE